MSNKQKIKGAEALLLSLIAEGTDTIFGYPGGQVIPIYDHLYHHTDRLNHILTRHEQGAVHAAQGYARATGKVGVCLATSGPGATNLVTGIADAMLDSTPIICITGQVPSTLLGTDAFQEADTISMTMPISKWNFQVTKASEIPGAIAKAYYIARTGRPGPVVIDISKNAQVEEFDYSYKPCIYLRSYKPHPEVDPKAIQRAVEMINAAERPLLIVGQGVKLAGAETKLLEFAEAAGIPMAQTLMGISTVPNSHPLFIGMLGMHGNIAGNRMTQQSDLIVAVGMRFSDRVTGNVKQYAPNAKIIHVDIDPAELGKNVAVELPIHADAGDAFDALKVGIRYKERAEWIAMAEDYHRREYEVVVKPSTDPQGVRISMYDVVSTLAEAEKADAVIVTDVGQHQMFSARYSKFNRTRSFITSGGLGTMGFGLPAAMGAKLGVPDREVVVMMGDGGFQMTMQELGTIMQNKIGVKMIVLNNHYLGMVRQWQQLFFEKRYSYTSLENPKFTMIDEAYGIPNRRVTQLSELKGAIDELAKAPGAYFLEVDVLSEENVFPMVPAGASLSDLIAKEPDKK